MAHFLIQRPTHPQPALRPGMRNPLDGVKVRQELSQADNSGLYQYFLKVVPTSYANLRNNTIYSNQFRWGTCRRARACCGD